MHEQKAKKEKQPRIRRLSFQMTLYFSVVIVITFLTLALLISNLFAGQLMKEMDDVLNRKMGLMDSELKNQLLQVQALHASLINDNILRTGMLNVRENGVDAAGMGIIQGHLTSFARQASYVTSIVAFDANQNILHSYYSLPPYSSLVAKSEEFKAFHASARTRSFTRPDSFPVAMGSQDSGSITYLGLLYDPVEDYETLGTVAINLKTSFLFSSLAPLAADSFDACFLTGPDGAVVYSTAREGFQSLGPADVDSSFRMYCTQVSGYPDWKLTCVLRESAFQSGLVDMYKVVIGMSLVALFFVILLSFYIAKTITRPIDRMKSAMVILGAGDYPPEITANSGGEMRELVVGFNTMVSDIRRLTGEIIEKQEKEKEYEVAMVQTRLDLLQLQINPHFIHNTLNSMKYMAQTAHNDELVETITAFNALLRASMSSLQEQASVMEEIVNTQNYLHLQRGRYGFAIGFHHETGDEAQFALLPKLILQPIVENALFHGIAPADGGNIFCRFEKQGNALVVTVRDDGVGIPEEKLADIAGGKMESGRSYSHIGLANVNQRLVLLYGEGSHLQMNSKEGRGTTVTFQIPFIT